jgi:AcrR family transcriptional regulator
VTESWDESLAAHRDRQRRLVFDTTAALAAEHGLASVTMAEVARRAGIGRATLYKYFPSVEHILAAMALDEVRRERAALDAALDGVEDPLERIEVLVGFLLRYFASDRHRRASELVSPHQLSPEVGHEVHAAVDEFHALLADMVRAAVASGALRAEPGADFAADALRHLLAAGREAVVADRMSPEDAARSVMAVFLDGTRARSARGGRRPGPGAAVSGGRSATTRRPG